MNDELRLVSTVVCDDVLINAGGRVTLYSIFRDLLADGYPTMVVRLHVVTTWLNPSAQDRQVIERVAILSPDGGELLADAATTFTVGPGLYHSQISRFRDLLIPAPGTCRVQVLRHCPGQAQAGTELVADLPLLMVAPPAAEAGEAEEEA